MNPNDALKQLVDIQSKIDLENIEILKEEYHLKLKYFEKLKETLEKRNEIAKEIDGFWESVLISSDFLETLYGPEPVEIPDASVVDFSWIDSLMIEFRPEYKYYIGIKAKENEYFENAVLEKEFSLFTTSDCIQTTIQWKNKKKLIENPLIKFFLSPDTTDSDSNMSIFHILTDAYFNSVYYYVRLDKEDEDEEDE